MATMKTIWLKVSNVRFDGESKGAKSKGTCEVQLEGDRQDPKPEWWTVLETATGEEKPGLENYRTIVGEMDKKRVVLAGLTCQKDTGLQVAVIRFQATDQSNR